MKKVLTFGVYDYFHLGHLRVFQQARKYGDYLIVSVQDGDFIKKFKPQAQVMYTTDQRVEMISALKIVDEVCVYQEMTPEALSKIDFDVLALGEDHVGERFDRLIAWCNDHNKEVVRLKRTPGICSTSIKQDLKKAD